MRKRRLAPATAVALCVLAFVVFIEPQWAIRLLTSRDLGEAMITKMALWAIGFGAIFFLIVEAFR